MRNCKNSARNLIFREVIANTLIHREYTNPYPAKLIIEAGIVHTENANKAHGMEQLTPQHFTPFPKNPVIARVFKEIGRADELGSGVRNIFEYYKYYSEQKPRLEEKDIFHCFVYTDKIEENRKVTDKVTDNQNIIIQLILENNKVSTSEMAEKLEISKRKVLENIKKLKEKNIVQRIGTPKAGHWIVNAPY